MLKAIHQVPCGPALNACQRLMQHFVVWLCSVNSSADLTLQNCVPPNVPSQIEGEWLWRLLQREVAERPLLQRAQTIANLLPPAKLSLCTWANNVSGLTQQFQPIPPNAWPINPPLARAVWVDFQTLMQSFYNKGLKSGLPYLSDGTLTPNGGVTYQQFVDQFRDAHRLNPNPEARETCVFCGGPLGQPEVDHWIGEGAYPILAVSDDNLVPICGECNSTTNKGQKPVHTAGSFVDWYHPYLRHTNGGLQLGYNLQQFSITVQAGTVADQTKMNNLDRLLKLQDRWTREFKAEYQKQLEKLRRSRNRGQGPISIAELQNQLQKFQDDLVPSEPHNEVHEVLAQAMLDPARVASWQAELRIP